MPSVKGFLAAAEARALAMREEMLATTRGKHLPAPSQGRPSFEAKTLRIRANRLKWDELVKKCAAHRAAGRTWEEIGDIESLSRRMQARLARCVKRL